VTEGFKIWRNPKHKDDRPVYIGEFYPPEGQVCFYMSDLCNLGFPLGDYTVRIPDALRKVYALPEWQKITVLA
jgi:hypothetical protein